MYAICDIAGEHLLMTEQTWVLVDCDVEVDTEDLVTFTDLAAAIAYCAEAASRGVHCRPYPV